MRPMPFAWACLLGFALAGPAQAQTGGKSGSTTTTGGTTTTSGTTTTGTGGGLFGLGSFFQLTPEQELELMMQALTTVEMIVTALQITDEGEMLFLFFFVYEIYRFEAILQMLTGGTIGTTGGM